MRRLILVLFLFFAAVALILMALNPGMAVTGIFQVVALALLALYLLVRVFGLFVVRRAPRIPPSQIAEIERLYFRSMRALIQDDADLVQVISDLQRILSIDPRYKNARLYLNRAVRMQSEVSSQAAASSTSSVEFFTLQEQLIDPDPAVRKSVVMNLIPYGDRAVDPLIALLMDDDPDVRVHAATALGWVGGRDAVQPLMVALQDPYPYVRRYAARALCWVVDSTAVEVLIQALQDEDNYVRRYAARALGWSQHREAIGPLLERLSLETNADVREALLVALDDLGEKNVPVERPLPLEE